MSFHEIFTNIKHLSKNLNVDIEHVESYASKRIPCSIDTNGKIDFIAEVCASMITEHSDYGLFAGRILMYKIHTQTYGKFSDTIYNMYKLSMVSKKLYEFVLTHADKLDSVIIDENDFTYSYFAVKTLQKSYLQRHKSKIIERPQYMLLRVACCIWQHDFKSVEKTYKALSNKLYTHASPTLFNAGTNQQFLSSCFLLSMKEDSVEGVYHTLGQCALISKGGGGVGISVSNIRAEGSKISSTGGYASGLVPLLKVYNDTCRYITQGDKRKGAYAVYLEPWHSDIKEFLNLKRPHGVDELRARDLFYGLWIPDIFMYRVENDLEWSLMCPHECPGLCDVWGQEFEKLYTSYEKKGQVRQTMKARDLWESIIICQQETGTPYMLYKDSCNKKSNQQNLGTIRSSNLCAEIIEYSSHNETAVCNLASISLPKFVNSKREYDFKSLFQAAYDVTMNLDMTIDITKYVTKESKHSNLKNRPIAVGVQGLADVFVKMKCAYESSLAKELNRHIFETIYFGCVSASNHLAKKHGHYDTFCGSPMSEGKFQFDMWDVKPSSGMWNWSKLREDVIKYGVRNSLLTALMPTASTAHILGNTESFEPINENIYVRRTNAGEFVVVNENLVRHLQELGLWNSCMKDKIILYNGSIQSFEEIPYETRIIHKTVWEMSSKNLIDMAVDRSAYIDQSQSFNCYLENPTLSKLTSYHFYAFKKGLKCGMYYLRSTPPSRALKFTVSKKKQEQTCDSCSC